MVIQSWYGMDQYQIGYRNKVLVIGIIIFYTTRNCLYNLDRSVCTVNRIW